MSGVRAMLHATRPVVVLEMEDHDDVVLLTAAEADVLAAQLHDAADHANWRIRDIGRAAAPRSQR